MVALEVRLEDSDFCRSKVNAGCQDFTKRWVLLLFVFVIKSFALVPWHSALGWLFGAMTKVGAIGRAWYRAILV